MMIMYELMVTLTGTLEVKVTDFFLITYFDFVRVVGTVTEVRTDLVEVTRRRLVVVSNEVSVDVAVFVYFLNLRSVLVMVVGTRETDDTVTEVIEVICFFLCRVVVDTVLTVLLEVTVF